MIIDSHAHYNNNAFKKPFRYLSYDKDGYALKEGERDQLFQELLDSDIPYSIEPGVSLQSCEEVLELAGEYPDRIFPAMGIHPTRSIYEKWFDRKKLDDYAKKPGVIAIGECGLDYHYKREEQHRLKQHVWFLYQLDLAWRLKKPVILHVRDAYEDKGFRDFLCDGAFTEDTHKQAQNKWRTVDSQILITQIKDFVYDFVSCLSV